MRGVLAELTCRNCGAELAPEAPAQVSEVVAFLPVQCTRPACHRHYAIKVELLSCPGNDRLENPYDGRKARYEKGAA